MAIEPIEPDNIELDRRIAERWAKMYTPAARARVICVDKGLIKHTIFKAAVEALDWASERARLYENIPCGVRIIGPSGSGKSTVLSYYRASLPSQDLLKSGGGFLYIRLWKRTSIYELIEALLIELDFPMPSTGSRNLLMRKKAVKENLKRAGVILVAIDEAHNLLARPVNWPTEGNDATSFLCDLIDSRFAVALVGGPSLERLREFNEYLYTRCTPSVLLKNFDADVTWRAIVRAFVALSTEHSLAMLDDVNQAANLHAATSGNFRQLKLLLCEAILVSADAGEKAVSAESMRIACDRVRDGALGDNPWKVKK